jgi:protocatechuate 3,4-dioxygenase beta subunit
MAGSISIARRNFLRSSAFAAAAFTTPGVFAEMLAETPPLMEGPFYPDKLPLDTDNDLLILNDSLTPGVGEITHLTGRILDTDGKPVRNAVVEIWQVDGNGVYLHSRSGGDGTRDKNFQGFGRFLTGSTGEYYFRTVKPIPYPGRTPHIHFAVNQNGRRKLTTQLFLAGHEQNARDGLYRSLGDRQKLVTSEFKPMKDSKLGELEAKFDLVLGVTPSDGA